MQIPARVTSMTRAIDMQNDDWMVPRRFGNVEPAREQSTNVEIGPEASRRQESKRQRLPQPKSHSIAVDRPWLVFDQRFAAAFPRFSEEIWTLGDTARWVIERTAEAVNGLSIDEDKLIENLPEMHKALLDGEVSAFATTSNDPVPRELPSETWSVYDLVVHEQNGLIRIYPINLNSTSLEQELLNPRLKSADVRQRWPSPSDPRPAVPPTTASAENQCRRWLAAMMKDPSHQRESKAVLRDKASRQFHTGKNAFERAWAAAIRETNAHHWSTPGRRF